MVNCPLEFETDSLLYIWWPSLPATLQMCKPELTSMAPKFMARVHFLFYNCHQHRQTLAPLIFHGVWMAVIYFICVVKISTRYALDIGLTIRTMPEIYFFTIKDECVFWPVYCILLLRYLRQQKVRFGMKLDC